MIKHERNELDKKWTWYLFLVANFLIILGIAVTWILVPAAANGQITESTWMVPTIVCNLLSIVAAGVFVYYENKNITDIYAHINKKWIKFYFLSITFYVLMLVASIVFYLFKTPSAKTDINTIMIIDLCVCVFISLVSMGLYRYARFKMDLEMYKRHRGEIIKENEKELADKKEREKMSKNEYEKTRKIIDNEDNNPDKTSMSASSRLIDHVDKE